MEDLDVVPQLLRVLVSTKFLPCTMAAVEKNFTPDPQDDTTLKEKALAVPQFLASDEDLEDTYGVNEKALLRKLDFKLLPAVSLLYLLSFLDRSNGNHRNRPRAFPLADGAVVANARIEGLVTDLHMSMKPALQSDHKLITCSAGNQYLTGLTLYFIGYVLFEESISSILIQPLLTSADSLQHRPQIDISQAMASDSDLRVGCRSHPAWRYTKYGRLLRGPLCSRHDREWSLPRCRVLLLHVV